MTLRYGRCARSPSMRRWSVCCFHRALKWHSASAHRPAPLSTTASIHSVCSSIERAPLSTISVISHTRFSTTELSLSALLPQRTEQIGRQHRIQAFEQPKPRGIRMEPASAEGGTESGRCEHALVVNTDYWMYTDVSDRHCALIHTAKEWAYLGSFHRANPVISDPCERTNGCQAVASASWR
jgi:hypothetical protein